MLAVTILTGNRPKLLKRTTTTIATHARPLLEKARVILMINGADDLTVSVARKLDWVDVVHIRQRREEEADEIAPIGVAVSELMAMVPEEATHVLHLEDDWECTADGWYDRALWILRRHGEVGQVRLRRDVPRSVVSQRTSRFNMVNGKVIRWHEQRAPAGFQYRTGDAHFTFNPSLVRRSLLPMLYPCAGERDAASKFAMKRLGSAQLLPGAFRHIGDQESLREKLGRVT